MWSSVLYSLAVASQPWEKNRSSQRDFLTSSSAQNQQSWELRKYLKVCVKTNHSSFQPLSSGTLSREHKKLRTTGNESWEPYKHGVSGINVALTLSTTGKGKTPLLWVFLWKKAEDSVWPAGSSLSCTAQKPLSATISVVSKSAALKAPVFLPKRILSAASLSTLSISSRNTEWVVAGIDH